MNKLKKIILLFLRFLTPSWYQTRETSAKVSFTDLIRRWFFYLNQHKYAYWPTNKNSVIYGAKNIRIGVGSAPGLSFGCYIFARPDSPIIFGDYNIVAPNVVVAGYSHDLYDYTKFPSKGGIRIGDYCWLAANSSIMPGVVLGDHVIVAANSVVTKSFKQGYCVVAGNPAKVVKELDPDKVVKNRNPYEYHGFIRKDNFESFSSKYLDVSKCVV